MQAWPLMLRVAQILRSQMPEPPPELEQGKEQQQQQYREARMHFLRLAIMPHTRTTRRLEDLQAS